MRVQHRSLCRSVLGVAVAGFAVLTGSAAQADAIYGCWSFGEERLEVTREHVETTSGERPDAEITRHSATFISPPGERDAGQRLVYRQLHDEAVARTVELPIQAQQALPEQEIWMPCGPEKPIS